MPETFLKATQLTEFLETLRRFGELNGPTVSDSGVFRFSPLDALADLNLDYRRTLIPPKKYLLPFREEILRYRQGRYAPVPPAPAKTVLFGLHSCDLEGIAYLDRVFLGDNPDPSYAARRSRLTLVGVSCEPDDFCFCAGGESSSCDLFMRAASEGFHLLPCTAKGREILTAASHLLGDGGKETAPLPWRGGIAAQDPDLRFLDHPLWGRFAETCVSCGACSVCCPTCYCFDLREYPALSGGGVRSREWDNCLFATHGEVAGADFRPKRIDRLRYRFLHKYCGFTPLQGMSSCVGCGRCREACPVGIDLRELIPAPRGESR